MMSDKGTVRNELSIGMSVEINPKSDRTRNERVKGAISEILTGSPNHTHGIMVKLEDGTVGRVKDILGNDLSKNKQTISELTTQKEEQIEKILANGESHFVEFKSSMLWSERLTKDDLSKSKSPYINRYGVAASKAIIASSIAGFLNADGGNLIIGIKENKNTNADEIIGIESEFFKLKDGCVDGYRRKILDDIIKPYFPSFVFNQFNRYLKLNFPTADNKILCQITVSKSDQKVYLNIRNVKSFYVRIDASTRMLKGEEVVDYCLSRFVKNN